MFEGEEEVALPFIQLADGKFVVDKRASAALSGFKGKLAVVCVAGPYRTGKSFLLNRLIGRQNGFKVGGSVNSCTKGIWLWGEGIREEGSEFRTIFLDSEGLGSIEQSATFDVQIFSLSLLLSSLFVLNTQGTINESALEQLELVVECTRAIQAQEGKEEDTVAEEYRGGDLTAHFPDFLWVLRDFMLELTDTSGSSMTAHQYLEKCLEDIPGNRKRVYEKNRLRQTLRTVFARRDCETLVRPVHDERQLQKLHEMPYESLRKEFRDQMDYLRTKVLRAAPAKAVDGVFLNGAALVKLAEAYCHALNAGGVPVVRSAWQSVIDMQFRDGMDAAVAWFGKRLQESFASETTCLNQEELDHLIQQVECECTSLILEHLVGEETFKQAAVQSFQSKIQSSKIGWINVNVTRARILGRQGIEKLWKESNLEGKIQSEAMGEGLLKDLESFIARALTTLPGPAVVREEICRLFLQFVLGVLSRALSKQQLRCEGQDGEITQLKQNLIEVNAIHAREREDSSSQIAKLKAEAGFVMERLQHEQTERKQLEITLATSNASLLQAESARAELSTKLTVEQTNSKQAVAEAQQKKEKWHNKFELLGESLHASREQTKAAELALERAKSQFHTEIGVLNQTAESTNQALQDANSYITELESQAKNRELELQAEEGKLEQANSASRQLEETVRSLREELQENQRRAHALEGEVVLFKQTLETEKAEARQTDERKTQQFLDQTLEQTQEYEEKFSSLTSQLRALETKCEQLESSLATSQLSQTEQEAKQKDLQVSGVQARAKLREMETTCTELQQQLTALALEKQEQTKALQQERARCQELSAELEKTTSLKLLESAEKGEIPLKQALERCAEFERQLQSQHEELSRLREEAIRTQQAPSALSLHIGEEVENVPVCNNGNNKTPQSKLSRKVDTPVTKRALAPIKDSSGFKIPKTRQQLQPKAALCACTPSSSPLAPHNPGVMQVSHWLTSPSRQI